MKNSKIIPIVAVAFVVFQSGCASHRRMYSGEALPRDQVAELEIAEDLSIDSIDGKRTLFVAQSGIDGKLSVFEVLPGLHSAKASYRAVGSGGSITSSTDSQTVTFEAVAGGKYMLVGEVIPPQSWRLHVVDVNAKKIITGQFH
jgi:hypothetical protein